MMKKQIALVALLFLGMSCFNASAQFKKFNLGKAIQAGKDAAQAISLSAVSYTHLTLPTTERV